MLKSVLHYQIVEKLGEGGMGIVYRAQDMKLNRSVALKFLPPHISHNPLERKRFQQEAQAAAALNHPNITQVYAIEELDDELFIVMEYVEGQELKEAIENQAMSLEEKCTIAMEIASGLRAAHHAEIIHRDIKSRNIMLNQHGRVKIMDFGLARLRGMEHITQSHTTLGTTAYMAPEQLAGEEMDMRSDIWAFGVVLYELFAGELPFQGIYEPAVMYSIMEEDPAPVTGIPPHISQVIQHCLVKKAENRHQTVDEIISDLSNDNAIQGVNSEAQKVQSKNQISYFFAGGIITVIVLIVAMSALYITMPWFGKSIPKKRYLAVLPIENIGNNPAMQGVCDGLAETFSYKLSELGKYEDYYWVAPASEMREEKVRSVTQANKLFGVNLAILSSIQTMRDSTRLILELVDADNIRQLDTRQVVVPARDLALLERKGVFAVMQMLDIQTNANINNTLASGAPSNPKAYEYYLKGRASLQDYTIPDSLNRAMQYFLKATELDSKFPLAYAGLGESYWRKYESEEDVSFAREAETNLQRASELNNKLAPVQSLLGLVSAGTGNDESAIMHFNAALKIDPGYIPAYRGLANVYDDKGEKKKAVATYQYAIALRPNIWEGYSDLGKHYLKTGDFEAAVKVFQKVVALTPQNGIAYSNLGVSYHLQGKYNKARDAYQMSLALGKNPIAASNLASIYFVDGLYEQSARLYEIALETYSNRYVIWGNLAAAYDFSGMKEKAHQAYLTAIEKAQKQMDVNPNDAEVIADLGAYYSDTGDSSNARIYIKKALALNDDDIQVRQRVVSTYEKLGLRSEALHWINAAMLSDIESQPELAALIKDPRFQALKEKLNTISPK